MITTLPGHSYKNSSTTFVYCAVDKGSLRLDAINVDTGEHKGVWLKCWDDPSRMSLRENFDWEPVRLTMSGVRKEFRKADRIGPHESGLVRRGLFHVPKCSFHEVIRPSGS